MTCKAHMSNHFLRGYAARLRGEPVSHGIVYQGQAKIDWEVGHYAASKEVATGCGYPGIAK